MSGQTPEAKAKARFHRAFAPLKARLGRNLRMVSFAGSPYGSSDTVDIEGLLHGISFAVEIKRFDGKGVATKRQAMILDDEREAGGVAFLVDSEESLQAFLQWVERITFVHTGIRA